MTRGFPEDPERRRRRDRILLALFLLLSLVLIERAGRKRHGVLLRNQEWGARFVQREDPYFDPDRGHRIHGPYPPSYALVCAPLSLLPTPLARRAWGAAQVGALLILYGLARRRLREHWPDLAPHAPMIFALAFMLASRYVLRDTKGGGGNLLYVTLALAGIEQALRGREQRAGWLLALGLVIKPNLAPLLLFCALRRRWRTLASVGTALPLLFLAPALHYGPGAYLELTARWATDVLQYASLTDLHDSTLVPDGLPPAEHGMNQSLRESVHRLLRPPGDTGAFDVHLIETSPAFAVRLSQGLGLALLIALARRTWRARKGRAEWLAVLAFLPLCLLLSPVTWKAHHAVLLPLFVALVACGCERPRPRWLVPGLWSYFVLCDLASVDIVGDRAGDYLQAISLVAWADVALILASLRLLRREEARAQKLPTV